MPDPQTTGIKASDLIARANAAQERRKAEGRPPIPTVMDRCVHGRPFFPQQVCEQCDIAWHVEMLAKAEASVLRHRAALTRLGYVEAPSHG